MFASLLSRFWWMILLRGVLAAGVGFVLFVWPDISLRSLILFFGLFALADGLGNVVNALGGGRDQAHWWVLLLAGLAGIALGALAIVNPAGTVLVMLFYIALWAISTGVFQILAAIRLRKEIEGEFWMMLGGLASVLVGMFLIARPADAARAAIWIIAAYALTLGVILIVLALKVRSFGTRLGAAMAARAGR